jgi:hypothetical protein
MKQKKKMTGRFTIDVNGRRAYIGNKVYYENKLWLLEDIQYLAWNSNQYLILQDVNNKNKKLSFISPHSIRVVRARNSN